MARIEQLNIIGFLNKPMTKGKVNDLLQAYSGRRL